MPQITEIMWNSIVSGIGIIHTKRKKRRKKVSDVMLTVLSKVVMKHPIAATIKQQEIFIIINNMSTSSPCHSRLVKRLNNFFPPIIRKYKKTNKQKHY